MRFSLAVLIAGISGFIALSYEILWFRAYSIVSSGSPATFGILLAFYLLGVAVGAGLAPRVCSGSHARTARTLALLVTAANVVGLVVVPFVGWCAVHAIYGLSLPMVAVSAAVLGVVLPLVSHAAIPADDRAGMLLSRLYLANILGSSAGSLVTGFVLMDVMGLVDIQRLLFGLGMALPCALLLTLRNPRPLRPLLAAVLVGVAGFWATPLLLDGVYEKLHFKEAYDPGRPFAHVIENRHGVIAVTQDRTIYGGGAYDGVFSTDLVTDRNWIVRCYGLAAMHPAPKHALMIGLSSGSWAQVVAHIPGLEKLTVIEINPGYTELIARYDEVRGLLGNPDVDIVIDDGRRWLQRHPEARFDLIVQNTTWHWRAHCTNLLSREYLELCKSRLRPGGVFYFNTTFSEDAMKTAVETFPHALRMINFMAVSASPLAFDGGRWRKALLSWKIEGRPVLDPENPSHRARLEHLMRFPGTLSAPPVKEGLESRESLRARLGHATVITDDNMICEWRNLKW